MKHITGTIERRSLCTNFPYKRAVIKGSEPALAEARQDNSLITDTQSDRKDQTQPSRQRYRFPVSQRPPPMNKRSADFRETDSLPLDRSSPAGTA